MISFDIFDQGFNAVNYFSLMLDETTDVSSEDQVRVGIFFRFQNNGFFIKEFLW